jgi:transposase
MPIWGPVCLPFDIERQPRKKLEPSPERLLGLLHRWRDEAVRAGRPITRIALAFEAGRDGFWLARWLAARGVEAHVIHASSVAVSREHRRAKTDRLDTELLKRGFLGWLRGERGHCSMARVPTIAEEDAKRPNRERDCLVGERTRIVNRIKSTLARLGIRNFKPTLRKAAERLATVHTPEGVPLRPEAMQKPASLFIVAPRAQASRRCETQATLGGKPPSFATVSVP